MSSNVITSKDSTGGRCDSSGLGYFVGGSRYGAFFAIPFTNTTGKTLVVNKLILPLGYWSGGGSPRTVYGAIWLSSHGPIDGAQYNVMDLYAAATDNLSKLRANPGSGNINVGNNSGKSYRYWYSPYRGLSSSDRQKVINAMILSTNTCTPIDAVDYNTTTKVKEYTFNFNDVSIPSGTFFYAGIYADEYACEGTSIAVRRLGYSSQNRGGSLDQKYYADHGTMVAANYIENYIGRWHFYHDYFTNSGHHNNYAQGMAEAKIGRIVDYAKPKISITSYSQTTKKTDTVTVTYGQNTATGNIGTTYVEYRINSGSWIKVSGSSNSAGSFTYVPGNNGVGDGATYTVSVRRVITDDTDNKSDIASVTMYTYKGLKLTGMKISPASTVNANTSVTVSWDAYDADEDTVCKIQILNSSNSVISTIANGLSSTITSFTFTPSTYVGIGYDNTSLSIKITRTGSQSGNTATASKAFKILYKPIAKVTSISPQSLGIIDGDKSVTWAYPDGYKGIVSGYHVKLTSTKNDVTEYRVTSAKCTIDVDDLVPVRYYKISIRPYYRSGSTYYYGDYTEISNYLYYNKGLSVPSITYPMNSSWIGNTYRVIFTMPLDYNYSSLSQQEQESYRYSDVEVSINNNSYSISQYPQAFSLTASNLTHECTVVFAPSLIGIPVDSTNILKIRAKSNFNKWSEYSSTITVKNMSPVTFTKVEGDIIEYEDIEKILFATVNMCLAYGVTYNSTISRNSVIYASDLNVICTKLQEMKNKVNNNYSYNNVNVKFRDFDSVEFVRYDPIRASDFSALASIIISLTT